VGLTAALLLFSGCEMLQQLSPSPSPSAPAAGNFDKSPPAETASTAAATAPQPPKRQAEFDAMMARLEKRGPAPTITPRSEPVAMTAPRTSVPSPAAAAAAPNHGATVTPPQAEPLIIRATPPAPAPRAGASQLLATNPPPKPVETRVLAATPVQPVQSLVVVGSHRAPPKSHAGLRALLGVTLTIILVSSVLLTFAPVRERLLSFKVATTVWWSRRKRGDKDQSKSKSKSKRFDHEPAPAWINTVVTTAAQVVTWVKALPIFTHGKPIPEPQAAVESHRPTPAEMLLKKIGAPPSNDVSTSRALKALKPGETSTTLPVTGGAPIVASEAAPQALVSSINQPEKPSAPGDAAGKPTPTAADIVVKMAPTPDEKSTRARVDRVLQAPFAPALITLMSAPPEPPAGSAEKVMEVTVSSTPGKATEAPVSSGGKPAEAPVPATPSAAAEVKAEKKANETVGA
jgi:hypothetical protein